MADSSELELPIPAGPRSPNQPLPRLWRGQPEPEISPVPSKKSKKAEPNGGKVGSREDGSPRKKAKPVVEETPTLDTYEARTRIRIAVGVGFLVLLIGVGFGIYRAIVPSAGPRFDELPDEGGLVASQPGPAQRPTNQRSEVEARAMMEQAQQVARNGKAEQAVSLLERIRTTYPGTAAAKQAEEALARPSRNLPLFIDGPAVTAVSAPAAEPQLEEPPAVVVAVPSLPSGPGTTDAAIILPVNPAEPGLDRPAAVGIPAAAMESRPLPDGFRPRPGTGVHPSGWPLEITGDRDGAIMVLVPGGTFTMGRDDGPSNEAPAHSVALSTFYIDQHEVTVRQYALFQRESGARPGSGPKPNDPVSEDHPVANVSARDAKAYADWAGKQLPTEAQWEMAARTPDGRIYPWGPQPPSWERPREPRQIDPVMSFRSDLSPYGIFDLAGNAAEWTRDWYDSGYYRQLQGTTAMNPAGPASSRSRPPQLTIKGNSRSWTVSHREGMKVDTRLPFLGFRCVLPVENTSTVAPPGTSPGGGQPVIPF